MDITMCLGHDCPKKEQCFRFTSLPEPLRQSYFLEIPGKWGWRREEFANGYIFDHREFQCEMFWGRKNTEAINTLNDIFDLT